MECDTITHARGKRSPQAYVRRLVLSAGYQDVKLKEVICQTTQMQLMDALRAEYDYVNLGDCDFMKGEVLLDAYGRGSLQKVDVKK